MEKESFTRAQIDEPLWTTEVLTSLPQGGAITQVQNVMFCNGECEIASYKDCAPKINTSSDVRTGELYPSKTVLEFQ